MEAMTTAPKPVWLVTYENVDVSDELAPMILNIEYTDNLKGQSDEVSFTVEDRRARWRTGWFPSTGDRIDLKLGYEGEPLLACGRFQVDEIELSGPPDTVQIRAMAAAVTQPVRTKQSRGFDELTLRDLVSRVAGELGLELVGDVADVQLTRVTQANETTLAFLRRLAEEYGYAFSIRDAKLVFFDLAKLEGAPPVAAIARTDLLDYRFKATTQATYQACVFSFMDPQTKALRQARVAEANAREKVVVATGEASAPPAIPSRTLRVGVTGDDVSGWQQFLASKGLNPGPIDGIFGQQTRAATIAFQRGAGIAADGVAGPETFRAALDAGYGTTTPSAPAAHTETAGNVLRIQGRAETLEQAELKARAALAAANRLKVTGSVRLIGRQRLVAGATFQLTDMGRLSGKFSVQKSTHRMDRSGGYTTECEVTFV